MGTEGPCPIGPFRNCERSQRNCERSQNGLLPGIAERSAAACFEDSEDESISDSRSSEITTAAVRSGVPNKVFGSRGLNDPVNEQVGDDHKRDRIDGKVQRSKPVCHVRRDLIHALWCPASFARRFLVAITKGWALAFPLALSAKSLGPCLRCRCRV
jgi:hypothetical protein